jgi:hypothetical protein
MEPKLRPAAAQELLKIAREVWESVPSSYDPKDKMVQSHSKALNALGAFLAERGNYERR